MRAFFGVDPSSASPIGVVVSGICGERGPDSGFNCTCGVICHASLRNISHESVMEFSWRVDVDQRYSTGGKTSQAGPPVASHGRFQEHLPLAVAFTVSGYGLSPLLADIVAKVFFGGTNEIF